MARNRDLSALINTVAADGTTGKLSVDPNTGQMWNTIDSQVGTDYFTTLYKGYLCRAWVNFNGTGVVAIRASGNVSSITDNGGSGDYSINFTSSMPDTSYSVCMSQQDVAAGTQNLRILGTSAGAGTSLYSTAAFRVACNYDPLICNAMAFR